MDYIGIIGVFALLVLCTIEDFKCKKIVTWHLIIVLPFLCLDIGFNHKVTVIARVIGILIGFIFFLLSKLTKEQIGIGDSYVIMTIGLLLGWLKCLEIITYSFFLSAIIAILLMSIFKFSRKRTIPFIPILLLGCLCSYVLGGTVR